MKAEPTLCAAATPRGPTGAAATEAQPPSAQVRLVEPVPARLRGSVCGRHEESVTRLKKRRRWGNRKRQRERDREKQGENQENEGGGRNRDRKRAARAGTAGEAVGSLPQTSLPAIWCLVGLPI